MILVHKYGGTSVGNIERINRVADHLTSIAKKESHKIVAVVSAMGQQTNELLALAKSLAPNPHKRELDMLLSVGERISMALLAIALHDRKIRCLSLTGSQAGILTDEWHTNARIDRITGQRLIEALENHDVVIVAGFQGVSPRTKEITTLGRGGSDLSAVALAHTLNADRCEIYTDVDGICTADPRIVSQARTLETIPWESTIELALAGAKVFHSRAAHVAQKFEIPVSKRSSFNLDLTGTLIQGHDHMIEKSQVFAISHKEKLRLLTLSGCRLERIAAINTWLWSHGHAPLFCSSQAFTTGPENTKAQLLFPDDLRDLWLKDSNFEGLHPLAQWSDSMSAISVVGTGFLQAPELVEQALKVVGNDVLFFEVRNQSLLFGVSPLRQNEVIRALHKQFLETT